VLNQLSGAVAADLEQAEALVTEAQFAAANPSLVHLVKGHILRARCRYEAAIQEYDTALAADRHAVLAYAALGQCKFFIGAVEATIPAQKHAIRLSPRDPHTANWYWRIGMVHLVQLRVEEAILWMESARAANPSLAGPRAWLASAYALSGETERAMIELAKTNRLSADRRYSSIARFKDTQLLCPKLNLMAEESFFAGLRKAGVPEY
jgi:tetratricopeptide (TPR) repeat protein